MTFTRQSGGGLLFLTEICGNGSLFDYYATKVIFDQHRCGSLFDYYATKVIFDQHSCGSLFDYYATKVTAMP